MLLIEPALGTLPALPNTSPLDERAGSVAEVDEVDAEVGNGVDEVTMGASEQYVGV